MDWADLIRAAAALALTLGLVGGAALLGRRFGPGAFTRLQASKVRRLTVVESLVLDPARRLVMVRVDDREHLLLLGEGRLLHARALESDRP